MFKIRKKGIEVGGFDMNNLPRTICLRKDEFVDFPLFVHIRTDFLDKTDDDGNVLKRQPVQIYQALKGFIKEDSFVTMHYLRGNAINIDRSVQGELISSLQSDIKHLLAEGFVKDHEMYLSNAAPPVYRGDYSFTHYNYDSSIEATQDKIDDKKLVFPSTSKVLRTLMSKVTTIKNKP